MALDYCSRLLKIFIRAKVFREDIIEEHGKIVRARVSSDAARIKQIATHEDRIEKELTKPIALSSPRSQKQWKSMDVIGYPNYFISTRGKIKNKQGRKLTTKSKGRYDAAYLCNKTGGKRYQLHQLVVRCFIGELRRKI